MIKKVFLALLLAIGGFSSVNAQNIFAKDDKVINLGIGFGSYLGGTGYTSTVLPISASYEQGIIDGLLDDKASIGVGGYVAYTANKWEIAQPSPYGFEYSYFILGARGLFHYQFVDKLDTYAGLMLGYNIVSNKIIGNGSSGLSAGSASGLATSILVGARYHFSDKLAAFAEVGYGIAALEIGISIKL